MGNEFRITVDNLIKGELDGKSIAIARYDEMLWKIRTGYAVFLYGALGIIGGLVSNNILRLNAMTAYSIIILIFGFSSFAALIDYSFMVSKLRVVNYRDRLIELAYSRAKDGDIDNQNEKELLECLKNSGERRESIDWSKRTGFWRLLFLYGGTCLVCVLTLVMLKP